MAEVSKVKTSVGRARRVTGFVLIGLGTLFAARMGWLALFYWSGFGHDEWVRFAGLLWLGVVLALAGCWLAYRSRAAAWTMALAVVVLVVMVFAHDRYMR